MDNEEVSELAADPLEMLFRAMDIVLNYCDNIPKDGKVLIKAFEKYKENA